MKPLDERAWVKALEPELSAALARYRKRGEPKCTVEIGRKLAYTAHIQRYGQDNTFTPETNPYETDILIADPDGDGWIPRVVVECKVGSINTHEALAYSAKAATHKQVHPYLRYGVLIGERAAAGVPRRLIRHGAYFDFLVVWQGKDARRKVLPQFCELLIEEVRASRQLQHLLSNRRSAHETKHAVFHRPLRVR